MYYDQVIYGVSSGIGNKVMHFDNFDNKEVAKSIKDENIVVDRNYNGACGIFPRALRDSAFSLAS
jgi:hypothetical protein